LTIWADLPLPAAERLVRAAVALRLLSLRPGGLIGLGALGAPMVGQAGLKALVLHHRSLYEDLADPLVLWRRQASGAGRVAGHLQSYWAYAAAAQPGQADPQDVAAYSELMAATQPWVASQILSAYPLQRHRQLLDVGGGEGVFARLVAQAHPGLSVAVFDLPAVAARARTRFAAAGLGGRAQAHAGDFHADALPTGADLVSLVRVVHDHDDEPAQALLDAVWRALPPGGHVLLAEPMAHTPGAETMGDAYFGVYLWAMGQGRPRSHAQLAGMLARAGFDNVRPWPTDMPLQVQVMSARRPAGKPSAPGT
jgi:demethylspheroidene O-methyltransferase